MFFNSAAQRLCHSSKGFAQTSMNLSMKRSSLAQSLVFYKSSYGSSQSPPSPHTSPSPQSDLEYYKSLRIFQKHSKIELLNLFMINKLLHYSVFVLNADKLYRFSSKVLGKTITETIIDKTMGRIFTGGPNIQTVKAFSENLEKRNLPVIVDYCCEALDEDQNDQFMDASAKIFEETVQIGKSKQDHKISVKLSGLCKMDLLKKLNTIAESQQAFFKAIDTQQRGYITAQELLSTLAKTHSSITQRDIEEFIEVVLEMPIKGQSFDAIRISQLIWRIRVHPYTYHSKKNSNRVQLAFAHLNAEEIQLMEKVMNRMRLIFDSALKTKTRVLMDAEQTYIQLAIDSLIEQSQYEYNKETPIVYNTVQNYLKSSRARIEYEVAKHKEIGIPMAMKMVRGAYINEETRIAKEKNTENPICNGLEKTAEMIHGNLDILISNMCSKSELVVGSHNADTVKHVQRVMQARNIPNNSKQIVFSQLLGLADHLTYSLLANGYSIFKYTPFGETHIMIPYLIRRAQESFQVLSSVELQYKLLKHEVSSRNPFKF